MQSILLLGLQILIHRMRKVLRILHGFTEKVITERKMEREVDQNEVLQRDEVKKITNYQL